MSDKPTKDVVVRIEGGGYVRVTDGTVSITGVEGDDSKTVERQMWLAVALLSACSLASRTSVTLQTGQAGKRTEGWMSMKMDARVPGAK